MRTESITVGLGRLLFVQVFVTAGLPEHGNGMHSHPRELVVRRPLMEANPDLWPGVDGLLHRR